MYIRITALWCLPFCEFPCLYRMHNEMQGMRGAFALRDFRSEVIGCNLNRMPLMMAWEAAPTSQ